MKEEYKKLFSQEIIELKKLSGKERGIDIKYLVNCVKKKEGDSGFKELNDFLKGLGFVLPNLKEINDIAWISESIPHIYLIGAARYFDWSEEDVFKMGRNVLTYSKTVKIFIKYFVSIKQTIVGSTAGWNKFYSKGKLEVVKFDREKKQAILNLRDFDTHPLVCVYLSGAIQGIIEQGSGNNNAKVKEVKCMSKGDSYHEFLLNW